MLCQRCLQRAIFEFLTAEKVSPTEIYHRLNGVYGDDTVDRSIGNRWVIKFCGCKPGKDTIVDETPSGRPITSTDAKHRKLVDDSIQNQTTNHFKSALQTILEYPRNVSPSLLNSWCTIKSVHDGYHAVSQTRTNSVDWNAASNFCSATSLFSRFCTLSFLFFSS